MFRTYGTLDPAVVHCSTNIPCLWHFLPYMATVAPEGQDICRKREYVKETVRMTRLFKAKIVSRTERHQSSKMRGFVCIFNGFCPVNQDATLQQSPD
jgi:hypothetical protein